MVLGVGKKSEFPDTCIYKPTTQAPESIGYL